ncbi:MAG: group II truncated hemoglobin [Pseudomonadota bacterium]|nr:globin [Pseudomonas sp.]MEC8443509.1 group II truncated hemoglobin [Pseudomonadota bacterium]|tara:strand:- start:222 stop:644 length:423 start_codon:yes stop_codon:yes gene_type:complete
MAEYGQGDASFQAAGQYEGIHALVDAFYDAMETLPEARRIRDMHPQDLTESRDKLTRFLCGWLGGPKLYREKYGAIAIPRAHAHLPIGEAERDAWLACMREALTTQPYPDEFKTYLMTQLFVPAERCRMASQAMGSGASG